MRYLLAFDGGGTKTDSVLFDETGHIYKRIVGKGGNATDLGKEEAISRFIDCLDQVISGFTKPISSVYGGMAGVIPNGDFYTKYVSARFPTSTIRFEDDGCNIISGGIGHQDGCGMVCGTGSSLFIRIANQPLKHIGGKGYLIDTGGSGFDLGQQAIKKALQSVDGRIGHTVLIELLESIIGHEINDTVIPIIHRGGRPFIASLAKAVFQGRKMGDPVCIEIFENGATQLADLTYVAEKYFEEPFPIVIGGGIASSFPEYVEEIERLGCEKAKYIKLSVPPIYGAAVEAMSDAGLTVTESFKNNFIRDYLV